MSELSAIISCC